jgi:hypothetical protein
LESRTTELHSKWRPLSSATRGFVAGRGSKTRWGMRRLISAAALTSALLLGGALTGGAPALAGPPAGPSARPSANDVAFVRASLTKYGVPVETQKQLLKAFAAGKILDSDSGAAPVSTEVSYVDGFKETVSRYKDGSFNASRIQQASETGSAAGSNDVTLNPSLTGLSGCQAVSAPGVHKYVNCQVQKDGTTYSVGYTAAITYNLGPLYGCNIDNIAGLHYGGVGSFDGGSLVYLTRNVPGSGSNYSIECRAQGTVVQHASSVGTRTVGLLLHVSSQNGGWQTDITT